MNRRTSILGQLRCWKNGAARYVVASFAVAYLSAGVAPCAMAASRTGDVAADRTHVVTQGDQAAHEHAIAHAHVGHDAHGGAAVTHDRVPAPADHHHAHCPHCFSGTATPPGDDPTSCLTLDDLTNAAVSHAKDAPQPLAPSFSPAAFKLPPPLASPRTPPPCVAELQPVALNVRHCVFLI